MLIVFLAIITPSASTVTPVSYTHLTTEENVTINGEEMTSPVPFAVISAMILPEDTASNIQVTNGKIFTMNDQSVVVGYACPGLKDSLKPVSYTHLDVYKRQRVLFRVYLYFLAAILAF